MKLASNMSNQVDQQSKQMPSTMLNTRETNTLGKDQLTDDDDDEDDDNSRTIHQHRRLPLPSKLSFEQNITHLIEKESPLLQSELLTAEHELSVLRSRLAVNEGVTAITGTILESLKGQFDQSQASPSLLPSSTMSLPRSMEIHYDAQSSQSPFLVLKSLNSYWIAQPIDNAQMEIHLKTFSSPVMKRATIQTPEHSSESDDELKKEAEVLSPAPLSPLPSTSIPTNHRHGSISEEDEKSVINHEEQLAELKTTRLSSSILPPTKPLNFYQKQINQIVTFLHQHLTKDLLNNLSMKFIDLKVLLDHPAWSDEDKIHLESILDQLIDHTSVHLHQQSMEFYYRHLQHLHERLEQQQQQQQTNRSPRPSPRSSSSSSTKRLIPESPVITPDVFFENHPHPSKTTPTNPSRSPLLPLIPEDAQIKAENFYEGDLHRSLYHSSENNRESVTPKPLLIPEKPLISSDVFYERPSPPRTASPPISIENLREIMSDLMLAASWSRKPAKIEQTTTTTTKDEEEIVAESFITTEERHKEHSICEIIHEIENFPLTQLSITIDQEEPVTSQTSIVIQQISNKTSDDHVNDEDQDKEIHLTIRSKNFAQESNYDQLLIEASENLVERILTEAEEEFYHQSANEIVADVLEEAYQRYYEEFDRPESSISADDERSEEDFVSSSAEEDNEENESLLPKPLVDPFKSKSREELENLVHELQHLEEEIPRRYSISSSSSSTSFSSDSTLSITHEMMTTDSVHDLTNLVSELELIEDRLEDQLDVNSHPIIPSCKSVNELGGLINELNSVTKQFNNRLHEEIFTSTNIDALSHDLVQYRRDSLSQTSPTTLEFPRQQQQQQFSSMISSTIDESDQTDEDLVKDLIDQIIREAQEIVLKESSIPTIIFDDEVRPSTISISDDGDLSHENNLHERQTELAAQLDYLRRMSRYDYESDENPSTKSLLPSSNKTSTIQIDPPTHFQSAYDLHEEEKSKLVRSPELYNIDHLTHRSLLNSSMQQRTLSESALTSQDSQKSTSSLIPTSQETSDEFLTLISKETSCESIQRHPTPYDDVMEKESSPEPSESSLLPSSAFVDTLEPTSCSRRPLILPGADQPTDDDYNLVADQLVHQVIDDAVTELTTEDPSSLCSSSPRLSSDDDTFSSSDDDDDNNHGDEKQPPPPPPLTIERPSLSKTPLRRAQTDTEDFQLQQSPICLNPPLLRRSSQSDTETYFRAVSPRVDEYFPLESHLTESDEDEDFILMKKSNENKRNDGPVSIQIIEHDPSSILISSIDPDIRQLLTELIDQIPDDMTMSISSEPLSSYSDATTVIFKSKEHSMDDDETPAPSSFISVISSQSTMPVELPVNVNYFSKKPTSLPSFSPVQSFDELKTKKFVHSHPGSFGDSHPDLQQIISSSDENESITPIYSSGN